MYHNTINIKFNSTPENSVNFSYNFLISKTAWLPNHKPIVYKELLDKMKNYGFNIDFINFPDMKDHTQNVFCEYNGVPNFNIFFKAYERVLKPQGFNITFEYGSTINGKFYPNNMNFYSSIVFVRDAYGDKDVIDGINYTKRFEVYQIVNENGNVVYNMGGTNLNDYKSEELKEEFFKSYKVSVYLRKYKLDLIQQSI